MKGETKLSSNDMLSFIRSAITENFSLTLYEGLHLILFNQMQSLVIAIVCIKIKLLHKYLDLEKLICFLWGYCWFHQVLNIPSSPGHPYALFSLSCHRHNFVIPHTYVHTWQCMQVFLQHLWPLLLQCVVHQLHQMNLYIIYSCKQRLWAQALLR